MAAMRRKLVFDDFIKLKQLFDELGITDEQITLDFAKRMVETAGEPSGESSTLSRRYDLRSEGEIIALLAAKNDIPEPTGLRYFQYFREYFDETVHGKVIFSPYNIKLLQTVNQLISKGLSPDEVSVILKGGDRQEEDSYFPAQTGPIQKPDRDYLNLMELRQKFPEEEDDEADTDKRGKAVKWGLVFLVLLLLAAAGSYQLGYLERWGFSLAFRDTAAVVVEEEMAEPGVVGDPGNEVIGIPAEEEIAAPPAVVIAGPELPALLPAEITVEVLNGSGISGVAARFAEKLKERGYQIVYVGNADRFDYSRSQLIRRLEEGREAVDFLDLIPQAELLSEAPGQDRVMFTVILGNDFVE